jgi:hypothetical protein
MLEHPPYSPHMSPYDYDLFVKMKEPLRGTHYNTGEEITRAVRRSLLDINRSGHADGARRLPQIWGVAIIWKECKCVLPQVIKSFQNCGDIATILYPPKNKLRGL